MPKMLIKRVLYYSVQEPRATMMDVYIDEEGLKYPLTPGTNTYISKGGSVQELSAAEIIAIRQAGQLYDGKGYALMPGGCDTHVHGINGYDCSQPDFNDAKSRSISRSLGAEGLSFYMPTLVTTSRTTLQNSLEVLNREAHRQQQEGLEPGEAQIVGVHLEGPCISPACRGAHDINMLRDSTVEELDAIFKIAPAINNWKMTVAIDQYFGSAEEYRKVLTALPQEESSSIKDELSHKIADAERKVAENTDPENDSSVFFIRTAKAHAARLGKSLKIFIGHTNPRTMAYVDAAVKAGADGFTHLGNACGETCCRKTHPLTIADASSNLVKWVLFNPDKCPPGVELIVDNVHLSSQFVQMVNERLAEAGHGNKIVLITDALGPNLHTVVTGQSIERQIGRLGSLPIIKEGASYYLADPGEPTEFLLDCNGQKKLAGSAMAFIQAMVNFAACVCYRHTTLMNTDELYQAAILNPRTSSLGLGTITPAQDQRNFILMNPAGKVVLTNCYGAIRKYAMGPPAIMASMMTQTSPGMFAHTVEIAGEMTIAQADRPEDVVAPGFVS